MKPKHLTAFFLLTAMLFLTSCDSIGLLSEKNSWLVEEIESLGDFFKVYVVLQLSILIIGVLLGFVLGGAGFMISLVLHFIWIVNYREYGFFIVLLLFGLFAIVSFLVSTISVFRKHKF